MSDRLKFDSTTIHGAAVIGAGVTDQLAQALSTLASSGSVRAAIAVLVYGLLHIFLPQTSS